MPVHHSSLVLPSVLTALICSGACAGPWFFAFNHWILAALVRLFPLTDPHMNLAEFFMHNRLVSGFVFAAAVYYFWSLRDERTEWRRARIIEAIVACLAAVAVTLAVRPFIGTLPPCRTPGFQELFPPYLWRFGSGNSFPSHSTLVYFVIAAGLWPLSRKCSAILCAWVLLAISLPRVYVGGHYPTDVVASVVIAIAFLWIAWRAGESRLGIRLLDRVASAGSWIEVAMFFWLFELGEGFRSAGELAMWVIRKVLHVS
jgi:membrane-associated phospholipid phosphatase